MYLVRSRPRAYLSLQLASQHLTANHKATPRLVNSTAGSAGSGPARPGSWVVSISTQLKTESAVRNVRRPGVFLCERSSLRESVHHTVSEGGRHACIGRVEEVEIDKRPDTRRSTRGVRRRTPASWFSSSAKAVRPYCSRPAVPYVLVKPVTTIVWCRYQTLRGENSGSADATTAFVVQPADRTSPVRRARGHPSRRQSAIPPPHVAAAAAAAELRTRRTHLDRRT